MSKQIIVSGIQPTGNLHLGNYLGALKNWVELQNSGKYEMYIFIADLHSLTGKQKPSELRDQTVRTVAELLAVGIDPEKTNFFVQSHVTEHTDLAWIFNCLTPMGELERMTQYKDKSNQLNLATAGLFTYPILQAADILLYKGEIVPVGQDQVQHLELTRDVGRWFNNKYGNFFPEVKPLLTKTPKVMSLLEPAKKMSKSLGGGHVIELGDDPEMIEVKIKKAVTATAGGDEAPGAKNLLLLLKEFGNEEIYLELAKAEEDGSIQYGDLKSATSKAIIDYFVDFREKKESLLSDRNKIADILISGAEKVQPIASKTMDEVREIVGLR